MGAEERGRKLGMKDEKFFDDMAKIDVLRPIEGALRDHMLLLGNDGIVRSRLRARLIDSDWIHIRRASDRICGKWMRFYWEVYKLLPKGCMGCWKICMKLNTLEQAMAVHQLQERMDLPSKTGIEKRFYAESPFSAFWYSPLAEGLEGARKLHKKISKQVHRECDSSIKVVLKRGCTELEIGLGPSDTWERPEGADALELLLDATFEDPPSTVPTTQIERVHIYANWRLHWRTIERARSLITYMGSIHNERDYPPVTLTRGVKKDGKIYEEEISADTRRSAERTEPLAKGQAGELQGEEGLGPADKSSPKEPKLTIV